MQFVDLTVEPDPVYQSDLSRTLASSDAIVREELLVWRMSRGMVLNQLSFVHGDPDVYARAAREASEIVQHEIRSVDDERFYVYLQEANVHERPSWWTAFLEHDFIHVPPVVVEDGVVTVTILGNVGELREVVGDLAEVVSVEIDSVGEYHGRDQRITDRLTTRQYRALRIATERGYYDVPREGSLADVAAELECTESTASDLLRRAEREVVYALVASVGE
ncbi:helix-turn-helix domain-containing protein [Natrarchaeobius sp. A-rgal3]|uniref:helix-turn-helix domain-containing protein n=1 Tax=Natrarchaeobius versutus TaxID=1679078 RepID=UPI003510B149